MADEFECLGPIRHRAIIQWHASPPAFDGELPGILCPRTLNTVPSLQSLFSNNAGFAFQMKFQGADGQVEISVSNRGMNCTCSRGHSSFACVVCAFMSLSCLFHG